MSAIHSGTKRWGRIIKNHHENNNSGFGESTCMTNSLLDRQVSLEAIKNVLFSLIFCLFINVFL